MKTKHLALLISALVLCTPRLWADDNGQQDNGQEDGATGGPIQGTESLDAKVVLTATANAPAGASGVAELEAEDENGTQSATLSLELQGLSPGDYQLGIIKISDGSTVSLGQISLGNTGNYPNPSSHEGNGDSQGSSSGEDKHLRNSDSGQSHLQVPLPSDLNVMDIAQIVVSDLSGNPLLVGDLLNPSSKSLLKFKATIRILPGEAAPGARGKALLRTLVRKGKRTTGFTLSASGVPAGSSFEVHLNGKSMGTVTSSKQGKVNLRKLPADLSSLNSVKLMDAQGRAVASAHF